MFFGRTGGCVAGVVEQKVNQIEPGVKSGEIALYETKLFFAMEALPVVYNQNNLKMPRSSSQIFSEFRYVLNEIRYE